MDKNELLEKINSSDLTSEQLNEIQSVLYGDATDRHLINKAEGVINKLLTDLKTVLTPNIWLLIYRFLTLAIIIVLIYALAVREPNNSQQVWTIVGAFIGFIFGQKSSFLRF